MKCSYCGKELQGKEKNCPYCAEPTELSFYNNRKPTTSSYRYRKWSDGRLICYILFLAILIAGAFIGICAFTAVGMIPFSFVCAGVLGLLLAIISGPANELEFRRTPYKRAIDEQYENDHTSICKHCGSHRIATYPKGYDYEQVWWDANVWKLKNAWINGGFEKNNLMCRCLTCGNEWDSGYDARIYKK